MLNCCFKKKAQIDISEFKKELDGLEDHEKRKSVRMSSAAVPAGKKTFTRAEVAEHAYMSDCWIILGDAESGFKVYDVSKYMIKHPGGSVVILEVAGQDAQRAFILAGHSTRAHSQLAPLCIGDLVDAE